MPYADPIKRKAYHKAYCRKWQQDNRERVNAYHREYAKQDHVTKAQRTRQRQRRMECAKLKIEAKQKPCADCKIQYPYYVMDFDHVPGRGVKLFNVSQYHGGVVETLKSEIAKCDVVCSNCHREREYRRDWKEV